jgi:protein-disulfide isomerase
MALFLLLEVLFRPVGEKNLQKGYIRDLRKPYTNRNGKAMSTRSQRGRVAQKKRGGSMGIFYAVLAVIAIAGVAVLATVNQGPSVDSSRPSITTTVSLDTLPARGKADAPVTVVEYADFQCPACGVFATTLEAGIVKDYVDTGKVRFVFHDFPLPQHSNAIAAAEAARGAADQGAFWPYHDLLYAKQSEWENSSDPLPLFSSYAEQLKLDRTAFEATFNSHTHRAEIEKLYQDSSNGGVNQTPTFVIDGKAYYANELRTALDAALKAKQ